jgi:membrane-associated phospholipid phosphatase
LAAAICYDPQVKSPALQQIRISMPRFDSVPWQRQMAARTATYSPLKAFGTMAFLALFFWAYFFVQRNPLSAPIEMPLTAIDQWVAFTPLAFPVYVSLWVYVCLPPALLSGLRTLRTYCLWIAALCLFCLGIFWLFPSVVPPSGIDWTQYPALATIKAVDQGGNAFPSLHVASAVFSALWLRRLFRAMAAPLILVRLNDLLCLAILWSTLATRQHVFLDVLAGAMLGAAFAILSFAHARSVAQVGELE